MHPHTQLVLSLFPGVDILGRAFSATGFRVVTGPDLILDTHIEDFHVPDGRFDGIIGGPPCQNYSDANRNRDPAEGDRLVAHFLRVIDEAKPLWWLMENVRNVPNVQLSPYIVQRLDITDAACGGRQNRLRHIQFGHLLGWVIRPSRTNGTQPVTPAVMARSHGKHDRHARRLERQGLLTTLAPSLPLRSLAPAARARAVGNGVPWLVGLALAHAVASAGPVTPADCACGCGREATPPARCAGPACRKRLERRRRGLPRTLTYPANAAATFAAASLTPPSLLCLLNGGQSAHGGCTQPPTPAGIPPSSLLTIPDPDR